jgi:hypothetical protein
MKHYLKNKYNEKIVVGIAGKESNKLNMNWAIVEDFE